MNIIKNFKFDKSYLKISLYALSVIIISIAFEKVLDNFVIINGFFKSIIKIFSPFMYGFFLAYILNPLVRFLETKIFNRIRKLDNHAKAKRGLSILITYLFSFILIKWFISFLVPEILKNASSLFKSVPDYIVYIEESIRAYFTEHPELFELGAQTILNDFNSIIENFGEWVIEKSSSWTQAINSTLNYFISGTMSIASTILNLILGIIISIYILIDKEVFANQFKKILYTLINKKSADKIMDIVHDSNNVFESFLVGKIIDSTIIGIICFVGLTLLNTPYKLLISLIVGITNMIPYFGPFIGAIPSIIITMAATIVTGGIWPTLWVALFILALQQFDGNILGPKILGNSTGLGPFWIIFSITIGGALAGVLGMFIGVPVFAVIYTMFSRFINRKYDEKFNSEISENQGDNL